MNTTSPCWTTSRIRKEPWYNGYNFLGEPVYNPFDILLFISENHNYRNFWFQSGVRVFELGLVFSQSTRNLVQFAGAERV
jgi:hypothetical protein